MSEQQNAEATATETEATNETESEQQKPSETVDFWKQKAREQEKRAKENAEAAKRLSEIENANKTEAEKTAERLAKADAEVAAVPSKVADALREHLVAIHQIDKEDAELFLHATEPELLLKQVARLVAQSDKQKKPNHVSHEGNNSGRPPADDRKAFANFLTGN